MQEIVIGIEPDDRFGQCIRKIIDGERDWPPSRGTVPAEIEAQRRNLAHDLLWGAELVDLVGHSTPIKCYLKLGDWVLDPAAAERLASYLPDSVRTVRLIGCSTASTQEGCAAASAFAQRRLVAYGTLNKVYTTHFDKGGVKDGIGAPPMRGFFPAERGPDPLPSTDGAADAERSRGLLVWLGRRPWRAILRFYRRLRRLLPSREDPRSRISGLLSPGITAMPGLLTEPLLVFGVASRAGSWTLEILFDFECARFYASVDAAGDRDLVYKIRGFGQVAKTPLETYLERAPHDVTLISRHEEAGNRCDSVPPARDASHPDARQFWRVFLIAAVSLALALLLALFLYEVFEAAGPAAPPVDASVDGRLDPVRIDAPVDVPVDAPRASGGPSNCATLTPTATATYEGFVDGYTSPQIYDPVTCPASLSIQINNYSPLYVGARPSDGTFVSWADAKLTSKTECEEEAWIQADLYRQISGRWTRVSRKQRHGTWDSRGCQPPQVGWGNAIDDPDMLIAGSDYRIVATARTSSTGVTRKFRVFSYQEPPR